MIESAKFTQSGSIIAVIDGVTMTVPDDMNNRHRLMISEWVDDGGVIEPYVEPEPPVPSVISRRQFYQGLAVEGFITNQEALDAMRTGAMPAALQSILDGMTDNSSRFEAEMLLLGAHEFHRNHPLTIVIAEAQDMSEQEVDDFWRLCASL